MTDAETAIAALRASADRLRGVVEGLGPEQLRAQAYPTEWSVADVLSHIGSGAEIMRLRLEAAVTGGELAGDFAVPIWDAWNAKTPEAKAADALVADRVLVDGLESLMPVERASVAIDFGPMQLDLAAFVGLRLNEHAFHTWDIEVALDPSATVAGGAVDLVVDNLGMIVRYAGKPVKKARDLHVRTSEPVRDFTLSLGTDAVALTPCTDAHRPDLELPAEAFIRLVYGRLDPDHTPAGVSGVDLAELRPIFPGL